MQPKRKSPPRAGSTKSSASSKRSRGSEEQASPRRGNASPHDWRANPAETRSHSQSQSHSSSGKRSRTGSQVSSEKRSSAQSQDSVPSSKRLRSCEGEEARSVSSHSEAGKSSAKSDHSGETQASSSAPPQHELGERGRRPTRVQVSTTTALPGPPPFAMELDYPQEAPSEQPPIRPYRIATYVPPHLWPVDAVPHDSFTSMPTPEEIDEYLEDERRGLERLAEAERLRALWNQAPVQPQGSPPPQAPVIQVPVQPQGSPPPQAPVIQVPLQPQTSSSTHDSGAPAPVSQPQVNPVPQDYIRGGYSLRRTPERAKRDNGTFRYF